MRTAGLTLIELLMMLTIVAIIALAGIPSFRDIILTQRMTTQINAFVHGVFLAKHAAHTRQTETVICKSPTGRQCVPDAEWSDGWLIFVNLDRDRPARIDADEPVLITADPFTQGSIRANRREFVFRAFELRSTNGTLVFCDSRGAAFARALVISYSGRPRIATTRPGGEPLKCPA